MPDGAETSKSDGHALMSLIAALESDAALIAAEDAAIWQAEHPIESVTDGMLSAPVGTPLASLIEALNAETPAPSHDES